MYRKVLLFILTAVSVNAAESMYDLSPAPQVIDGEKYPRNNLTLFRGTNEGQLSVSQALRAMLGDQSVFIETLFFSTLKKRLVNQPFDRAVNLSSFLTSQIDELQKVHGGALDEASASRETQKLVDGTFNYLLKRNEILDQYVNYNSSSFIDWPNNMVFTTILSPVAATYGDRILVIQEKKPRSLDLNYWNHLKSQTWYHYTRDIGEFIAFGYLNPSDLVGYEIRTGTSKSWHSIQLALFKSNGAVLVMSGKRQDGSLSTCIRQNPKDDIYYHCEYRMGSLAKSLPHLTLEKVQLLGAVVLCDQAQKSCQKAPVSEMKKYSASSDIDSFNSQSLQIQFNRKTTTFLPAKQVLKQEPL